jgi:ABC-2 type transport system ATP-binding protein/lipopolysaccharide transport system ATP-binding protein
VSEIAIRVESLSKTFNLHLERRNSVKERVVRGKGKAAGRFVALNDLSFEIERGTTFGLIGHNGSGKSTLLKILAGVYRPSSGAVMVDGRVSALLELGAGFHGELTGRENIFLNGAILGMSKRQVDASLDKIIDFAGIGEFIDTPVKIYSSGMYVRLGFAIAVTLEPEILIVDEIIAVGDEEFQRKCFDHLFKLRNQGTTIVLVTHSMGLAAELCDNVLWLDHGNVRGMGPAVEVIDSYLADVNLKEAKASSAEIGQEDSAIPVGARSGSGEVQVTHLEFLGSKGSPAPVLLTGEEVTIRMHFVAKSAVSGLAFALGFNHENGIGIAGATSRVNDSLIDVKPGSGYVDYCLTELPLLPATWRISTRISDHGHTYDHLDKGFPMVVRAPSGQSEAGAMRIRGTWSSAVVDGSRADAAGAVR